MRSHESDQDSRFGPPVVETVLLTGLVVVLVLQTIKLADTGWTRPVSWFYVAADLTIIALILRSRRRRSGRSGPARTGRP